MELRESHRYLLGKSTGKPQVAIGDIVLVHDEALPRGFWKLGRIQSVIVGRDRKARAATVKLMSFSFFNLKTAKTPFCISCCTHTAPSTFAKATRLPRSIMLVISQVVTYITQAFLQLCLLRAETALDSRLVAGCFMDSGCSASEPTTSWGNKEACMHEQHRTCDQFVILSTVRQ